MRPSMGSVGDCYDNAMCESFFATLECELLDRVTLRTPAEARTAVFDFIEGWYNSARRHSSLDYESPLTFERRHADRAAAPTPAPRDRSGGGGGTGARASDGRRHSRAGGKGRGGAMRTGLWKLPELWTHRAAPTAPWKTTEQVFHSYHRPSSSS